MNKRNSTLLVFLFIAIGCTRLPNPKRYEVPKELQHFVTEFEQAAIDYNHTKIYIDNLVIVYKPLEPLTNAKCYFNLSPPKIVLNIDTWADNTTTAQRLIIYHELGHCILGYGHRDFDVSFGQGSIMNTYLLQDSYYLEHVDYYLNELFHPYSK